MMEQEQTKKPIYKKVWFWLLIVAILIIIGAVTEGPNKVDNTQVNQYKSEDKVEQGKTESKVEVIVIDFSAMQKAEIEAWCNTNKIKCNITEEYSDTVGKGMFVSQSSAANSIIYQGDQVTIVYSLGKKPTTEYKNALKKAESYSKNMHMSKQKIYDQLTSEYGEKFPADAAQYAIDNIQADWNANALAKAKSYQNNMNMSKQRIYTQLTSEYGEKFTKEQAQYAIDHLED